MSISDICANTYFIDQHIKQQEEWDRQLEVIYTHIVSIFKYDFETKDYDELISDLEFEIGVEIDSSGYETTVEEVLTAIVNDFNIKDENA